MHKRSITWAGMRAQDKAYNTYVALIEAVACGVVTGVLVILYSCM